MATSYPALFVDRNGETRIAGTLTFTANEPTFNGGTITQPLVITPTGTAVPLTLVGGTGSAAAASNLLALSSDGQGAFTVDAAGEITSLLDDTNGSEGLGVLEVNTGKYLISANKATPVAMSYGIKANPIASGALPTVSPSSGTALQCSTTRDVTLVVPFTGDATNNAATLKLELSPDNVTFSTLDTLSIAAALNLTGAINAPVTLAVPAAWYVKLTATHGTIGTGTYY